jgi:Bacterial self-protective colicin-like immunity
LDRCSYGTCFVLATSAAAENATSTPEKDDHRMTALRPYIELVSAFVDSQIDPTSFERQYFALYLNDQTSWSDEEFAVLDKLFGDADAFEPDPEVRAEMSDDAIDETELRRCAAEALPKLRKLASKRRG